MMRLAAAFILALGWVAPLPAQVDDKPVWIEAQQPEPGVVRLILRSDHLTESTLILSATLENMESSVPLPLACDVKGRDPVELCVLQIVDTSKAWHYHYDYKWKYGTRGGVPDPDAVYLLPYRAGERHTVMQGYRGAFSHQKGSVNEYAYDFQMPVGTTVCAARAGTVIAVRQDSGSGGSAPEFQLCANYVMIRHGDGTYAEYLHLKKGGALVSLGDAVEAGQPIGLSGVTGFTSGPHVHFAVFRVVDQEGGPERESLPMTLRLGNGQIRQQPLVQGEPY